MAKVKKTVLLVTGMAGAGKSEALTCLEDLGFECVDNMPLSLIQSMMDSSASLPEKLALGVGVRTRDLDTHFTSALRAIRENPKINSHVLFLHANTQEMLRRFNTTRRRHPLAVGRPLAESITLEKQILEPMRQVADSILDTTDFNPADLWRVFTERFSAENTGTMQVFVMSFGFKHGLPREVDMVFDVRYLNNPYWDANLRDKTGMDKEIQDFVMADTEFTKGFSNIKNLVTHQLEQFAKTDRAYVTIGVGCTGGMHRSVTVANKLASELQQNGFAVRVHHRDMPKAQG